VDVVDALHYYRVISRVRRSVISELGNVWGCKDCSKLLHCWNGDFREVVLNKDGQCLSHENGNVIT
jgi:hypothetical protein